MSGMIDLLWRLAGFGALWCSPFAIACIAAAGHKEHEATMWYKLSSVLAGMFALIALLAAFAAMSLWVIRG